MNQPSFQLSLDLACSPIEASAAIRHVRGWWSGTLDKEPAAVGDVFTYQNGSVHRSVQQVVEDVPGVRTVWRILEADLAFAVPRDEWVGTTVCFLLTATASGCRLDFVHEGLAPSCACYNACAYGWTTLLRRNLAALAKTGEDQPSPW